MDSCESTNSEEFMICITDDFIGRCRKNSTTNTLVCNKMSNSDSIDISTISYELLCPNTSESDIWSCDGTNTCCSGMTCSTEGYCSYPPPTPAPPSPTPAPPTPTPVDCSKHNPYPDAYPACDGIHTTNTYGGSVPNNSPKPAGAEFKEGCDRCCLPDRCWPNDMTNCCYL